MRVILSFDAPKVSLEVSEEWPLIGSPSSGREIIPAADINDCRKKFLLRMLNGLWLK